MCIITMETVAFFMTHMTHTRVLILSLFLNTLKKTFKKKLFYLFIFLRGGGCWIVNCGCKSLSWNGGGLMQDSNVLCSQVTDVCWLFGKSLICFSLFCLRIKCTFYCLLNLAAISQKMKVNCSHWFTWQSMNVYMNSLFRIVSTLKRKPANIFNIQFKMFPLYYRSLRYVCHSGHFGILDSFLVSDNAGQSVYRQSRWDFISNQVEYL